ncbi:hypothetical protein PIB30_094082 [Stylosanthes scabra]|uniref:Uncharacterized protein n=1 Tax=Stylosanthes scabra TaxID=79078 RepID=A0ABU6VTU8_9FABA|nr:hypothetical protein [Stylosanthes scabra]
MEENRKTDENGKPVVRVPVDDPYVWVKGEVKDIVSLFRDLESVGELGDPSIWVWEGENVRLEFIPCSLEDRFECGVLSQMKCAPSQIHPNVWAFIRGFEVLMDYLGQKPLLEMYVRVRSLEDQFPFFVDEYLLERFPLYWYAEPVQILGMNEVDEESGLVVNFLDQSNDRGLKNFFKMRNERELSTSNVVKSEHGVVVNHPLVKRKPISVKRRRAEEGTSERGKVIDLTSSKCCGKEVSLDEVKVFTANQKKLHGYVGAEDLSSLWSEHYPLPVVAEENFQSKADFDLIESVSDIGRAQFMQVYAARMLCIGRYE